MMYKLKLIVILLIISTSIYSQPTLVNSAPMDDYSIDHFTGEIYYRNIVNGIIYKIDPLSGALSQTEFPSLPVFANKSHKAAFTDYNKRNAYLYDFATKTETAFPESIYVYTWPKCSFSPNDKKVALNDYIYDFTTGGYHFNDDLFQTNENKVVWTSDSSILIKKDNNKLLEYYTDIKRNDTLIYLDNFQNITDFSYSFSRKELFYSTFYLHKYSDSLPPMDFTLFAFDRSTKSSKQLYSFWNSEIDIMVSMYCTSMKWSPHEKLLGFIGLYATQPQADLYVYNPDSAKVFRLTNKASSADAKISLRWSDDKTFYYINSYNNLLYKYNLPQNITRIAREEEYESNINLTSFPNPFNNSTIINFSASANGLAYLRVYNAIGQLVKEYNSKEIERNRTVRIVWNGTDDNGQLVGSGIYYVRLQINAEKGKYFHTSKLIFIK